MDWPMIWPEPYTLIKRIMRHSSPATLPTPLTTAGRYKSGGWRVSSHVTLPDFPRASRSSGIPASAPLPATQSGFTGSHFSTSLTSHCTFGLSPGVDEDGVAVVDTADWLGEV